MMKRPKIENSQDVNLKYIRLRLSDCLNGDGDHHHHHRHHDYNGCEQRLMDGTGSGAGSGGGAYQYGSTRRTRTHTELLNLTRELDEDTRAIRRLDLSYEVQRAVEGALYIANHLKKDDQFQRVRISAAFLSFFISF